MWTYKSYSAVFEWINLDKRESVRLALLADGLDDIVARLANSYDLRDWYQITSEAAVAVGPDIVERMAGEAMDTLLHDCRMLD